MVLKAMTHDITPEEKAEGLSLGAPNLKMRRT